MVEHQGWHPVALSDSVADAPVAVLLLGEPLVLWRSADAAVMAWADRCPHRGAQLSMGCVRQTAEGSQIECPYHGWRFDRAGQAVRVPALPDFIPPATHHATVYQALEGYGLVWVRLMPGGDATLPAFAAEDEPALRKVNCGPYDVATSAPRIVENFLDLAHFGFVHDGWLGDREHTALADYRVERTATGFIANGCKAWQPKSSVQAQGGADVHYSYEVNAPYTAVLTKMLSLAPETPSASPPRGGVGRLGSGPAAADPSSLVLADCRESIALFICPLTAESSRVWFRLAMNDFDSTEATLQAFQHTIFMQDRPVLESQSPKRLPISDQAPVQELHSAADRSAMAYRRFLRERGITYGTC